ncbi:MAG: tripartite tricarboxylate transporter substrate binding protein [Alphaproteobacteria bacterium]|nr:tripartite tricarboxylate transporter substrate binding protein [Alphaproteobacteria bacterium]
MGHGLFCIFFSLGIAVAQQWAPDRPVTILNPYTAGSTTDQLARALAAGMAPRLGQPVVFVNRDSAAGGVGTAQAARATPDRHYLLFAQAVVFSVLPARGEIGFTAASFVPVCQSFENAMAIAVRPESRFSLLTDVIAAARTRSGAITYGHQGIASVPHLAAIELAEVAGIQVQEVPYRGEPALVTDLRAGRVDFAVLVMRSLAAGGFRTLGVFAPERHPLLPDAPTVMEQGFAVAPTSFGGLSAPAKTLAAKIARLEAACLEAAREEAYRHVATRMFQPMRPEADAASLATRLASDVADKRRLLSLINEAR